MNNLLAWFVGVDFLMIIVMLIFYAIIQCVKLHRSLKKPLWKL